MLLSMPDLYAQLAETLQRLFADFGIAAWRLQRRQRLQFAGMVHHHMAHWNRGAGRLAAAVAAAAGRHGRQPSRGGGESSSMRPSPALVQVCTPGDALGSGNISLSFL